MNYEKCQTTQSTYIDTCNFSVHYLMMSIFLFYSILLLLGNIHITSQAGLIAANQKSCTFIFNQNGVRDSIL